MATCEGCSLTQTSSGHYLATVDPSVTEATIHTFVDRKEIGNTRFLVAKVPKPIPQFGTITTATAMASDIANQNVILCALGTDIPYVGLKYTVTKFSVLVAPKDTSMPAKFFTGIKGNVIPPDLKTALSSLMPSDMISIFGIEAIGPDKLGLVKLNSSIVITVE